MATSFKTKPKEKEEFSPKWGEAFGIDFNDLPEIIPSLEGKIISLFDPITKEGDYGEYTMQNIKIETEHGEIAALLFDHVIEKRDKGKRILASCGKVKGKGLTGLRYQIDEWEDKKTGEPRSKETLVIDKHAEVQVLGGTSAPATAKGEAPRKDYIKAAKHSAPASQDSRIVYNTEENLIAVAEHLLGQHRTIRELTKATYPELEESSIEKYVATMWIAMDRIGAISYDPSTSHKTPRVEAEPTSEGDDSQTTGKGPVWSETVIPAGSMMGRTLGSLKRNEIQKFFDIAEGKKGTFWDAVNQAHVDLSWEAQAPEDDDLP